VSIVSGISPSGDLVRRIRGEYLEMPGLRVTAREAQRLFGLDAITCDKVLDSLLQSGFLSRAVNGMFRLAQAGDHTVAVMER
jgi:predicted transcriptional regulator of viral defense system